MKAMILEEFGAPLKMRQIPEPVPGPQEILLKVRACGVCRTDIKISKGEMSQLRDLFAWSREYMSQREKVRFRTFRRFC
jgi:D-arabinose 1-dehydrogenase-like Zn-dependent alcohol dehydrogenase